MWFNNLHLYRVHGQAQIDAAGLEEYLAAQASRPVGSQEFRRIGWCAPAGQRGTQLHHELQGQRLLTALRQERILPSCVVREEVEERAAEIEAREGRRLLRRERQELKEQVFEELLPQAFVRSQRFDVWWDTGRQLIGINAASRTRAEEALDLLRMSLGSLKVTPLATQTLPMRTMTAWLSDIDSRPAWLTLGDRAELKAQGDDGILKARHVDLDSDEMQQHLAAGRQASKLELEIEGLASLLLHDDLSIKGLHFADALLDEAGETEDDGDAILRLETDFIIMAKALGTCIDHLVDWMGGEAESPAPLLDGASLPDGEPDPLYDQAKAFVIEARKASVSSLQRHLKIGYNRAFRFIETMESEGVVSPMDGSGSRKVLAA